MVEYQPRTTEGGLDRVFRALSDPTRRDILRRLSKGPRTVGQLSAHFPITLAGVSKHLKILERVGLIAREVRGREHHCSLVPQALLPARAWLDFYQQFWSERLDALEELLSEPPSEERDDDDT